MTQKEAVNRWMTGEPILLGEYRNTRVEKIQWDDNGKRREAIVCSHGVEFGSVPVSVQERVPDGVTRVEDVRHDWKKSEKVVVHVQGWSQVKGAITVRGILERVTPDSGPSGAVGGGQHGPVK